MCNAELDSFVSLSELLKAEVKELVLPILVLPQTIQTSNSNDQRFGKSGGTPPLLRFGTAAQHKFQLGLDLLRRADFYGETDFLFSYALRVWETPIYPEARYKNTKNGTLYK